MFHKNSLEQISFDLTQQNLDFTPKSIRQSPCKLNYSDSNISIDQVINEPLLSLHIEHEGINTKEESQLDSDRFRYRSSHFFQFNKGLKYCIDLCRKAQENRHSLVHQNKKPNNYCKSYSRRKGTDQKRNQSTDSQNSEQKSRRNQANRCLKAFPLFKQNVEFDEIKRYENKPKNPNHLFTEKQLAKLQKKAFKKSNNQQFPKIKSTITVKNIQMSQDQLPTKRIMKKIGIGRQIQHRGIYKICALPLL